MSSRSGIDARRLVTVDAIAAAVLGAIEPGIGDPKASFEWQPGGARPMPVVTKIDPSVPLYSGVAGGAARAWPGVQA